MQHRVFLLCRFSDRIPFRERSETPEIAIELSLQPWRAFGTDAVIMFSDILTVLPALGIEFDMVKGKGPVILNPVRCIEDVQQMRCDTCSTPLTLKEKEIGGITLIVGCAMRCVTPQAKHFCTSNLALGTREHNHFLRRLKKNQKLPVGDFVPETVATESRRRQSMAGVWVFQFTGAEA